MVYPDEDPATDMVREFPARYHPIPPGRPRNEPGAALPIDEFADVSIVPRYVNIQ